MAQATFCFPQSDDKGSNWDKKYFGEIILGASMPIGDFYNSDINNSKSGFAETGGYLFASYGVVYNNILGYDFAVSTFFNPLNDTIGFLLRQVQAPLGYTYGYKYGQWFILCFMTGPRISLPIRKFVFDFSILGGIMFATKPYITQGLYSNGVLVYQFTNEKGHGAAFTIQPGIGIRYSTSDFFDIMIYANYIEGIPKIEYQVHSYSNGIYSVPHEIEYRQPITTLNFGFGIIIKRE